MAYTDPLAGHGVAIRIAVVDIPEENGCDERMLRTIREQEIDLSDSGAFANAYGQLGRFLDDVYNRKRIHSAPGYLTAAQYEQRWSVKGEPGPTLNGGRYRQPPVPSLPGVSDLPGRARSPR